MRRIHRIAFLAVLALALPTLSGCADFDADKLDIFGLNEKKKLPGDRKPVFPEGVPGVTQGIPQEFIKGNQPPQETAAPAVPPEPEKPAVKPRKTAAVDAGDKPKRKPKPRTTTTTTTTTTTAAPTQPVQSAPDPAFDRPAPAAQQTAPWPAAPAPNTFSR
jgi:hypothetical protein